MPSTIKLMKIDWFWSFTGSKNLPSRSDRKIDPKNLMLRSLNLKFVTYGNVGKSRVVHASNEEAAAWRGPGSWAQKHLIPYCHKLSLPPGIWSDQIHAIGNWVGSSRPDSPPNSVSGRLLSFSSWYLCIASATYPMTVQWIKGHITVALKSRPFLGGPMRFILWLGTGWHGT